MSIFTEIAECYPIHADLVLLDDSRLNHLIDSLIDSSPAKDETYPDRAFRHIIELTEREMGIPSAIEIQLGDF